MSVSLFELKNHWSHGSFGYDLDKEAMRFLMLKEENHTRPRVVFVQNWLGEIEQILPD
jgi:hypothetical protein